MKIITYKSPEQLFSKESKFEPYREAIHITATQSLKQGILKGMQSHRWIQGPVVSFSELLPHLGGDWFKSKTTLIQNTMLSQILRKFVEERQEYSATVFQSIDKNQNDIIRTMRTLIESNLTPKTVESILREENGELTPEKEIFLILWEKFEKTMTVKNYKKWVKELSSNPKKLVEESLENLINDLETNDLKRVESNLSYEIRKSFSSNRKALVFHGFYFITPFQQVFLDALRKDYEIVHLIQYEQGHSETFKSVYSFLEMDKHKFVQASTKQPVVNKIAASLLYGLEGEPNKVRFEEKVKHIEFTHAYQFKAYLQTDKFEEDEYLYTARASEIRPYLATSEDLTAATLKEFPVGHFLLDIHRLNQRRYNHELKRYDDYDNTSIELLSRILSSGYLKLPQMETSTLIHALFKLKPILKECNSLDDYISALKKHINRKVDIEETFNLDVINGATTFERELIVLSEKLSYFHVKIEEIDLLIHALEELERLYQLLFTDKIIEVSGYATTLQNYLEAALGGNHKSKSDHEVMRQVMETLADMQSENLKFDRRDLISGITFFLSRNAEDTESDRSYQSGTNQRIRHFIDVDGIPFDTEQTIHLAFFDNEAMPMQQNLSIWPLERKDLRSLSECNRYIKRIEMRHELSAEITHYLLYIATYNSPVVKFSSVTQFGERTRLYPAFYSSVLGLEPERVNLQEVLHSEDISSEKIEENNFIEIGGETYPDIPLLRKTEQICPKRLALSLYFQSENTYRDDFHHGFLYSGYIHYYLNLKSNGGIHIEDHEIKEYVDYYFPQWTDAEKTFHFKHAMRNKRYANGLFATNKTKRLIQKGNIEKLFLFGKKPSLRDPIEENGARKGEHCKYCPFRSQCIDAGR